MGCESCGRCSGSFVGIYRNADGQVRESGVWSCDRVWLCAVCSSRRKAHRASEVEAAAMQWSAQGGYLLMVTFTVRHDRSMSLAHVLDGVMLSWRALQGRASFRSLKREVVGSIKALEITDGDNGWHPHLHVLFFVPAENVAQARRCAEALTDDWRSLTGGRLGATPSVERALKVQWIDASGAAYVSKIGKELAMADSKSGRDPFALLDVTGPGAAAAGARFVEYGVGTKGRQSLVWSPGLRAGFDLAPVDDEPTATELQKAEDGEAGAIDWFGFMPKSVHTRFVLDGSIDAVLARIGGGWWPSAWPRSSADWPRVSLDE